MSSRVSGAVGSQPEMFLFWWGRQDIDEGEGRISDDEGLRHPPAWQRAKELLTHQIEFARASSHDSRPTQACPSGISVSGIQWTLGNYGPPCGGVPGRQATDSRAPYHWCHSCRIALGFPKVTEPICKPASCFSRIKGTRKKKKTLLAHRLSPILS